MRLLGIVAARELVERARSKAFVVSNVIILVVVALVAIVPQFLGDPGPTRVAVTDADARELATVVEARDPAETGVEVRDASDRAEAEELLTDGDVDLAIVGADTVLSDGSLGLGLEQTLTFAARSLAIDRALEEAGFFPGERQQLLAGQPLDIRDVGEATAAHAFAEHAERAFVAVGAVALLYGLLIVYGQWVGQGLVEEKQSRVIEVMLATVTPQQLLAGKVLGIGALGLGQIAVIAVAGTAAALAATDLSLGADVAPTIGHVLAWFLIGYGIYALLFAAVGALVARVEDFQSAATPVVFVLVAGIVGMQFALQDPQGTVSQVLGYVPFTAPLIQPIRAAAEVSGPVEVAAAAAIGLTTVAVLVPIAARIYAGGVLRTRGRLRLREAWQARS